MLVNRLITKNALFPESNNHVLLVRQILLWFQNHNTQAYYAYHHIRGDIIFQYENQTNTQIMDSDLDLFDLVLESLEELGYGQWCATQEDPEGTDLYTYFYINCPVTITPNEIFWHFKMRQSEAWIDQLLNTSNSELHPKSQHFLKLFKRKLLQCKSKSDYKNLKHKYYNSAKFDTDKRFADEIFPIIQQMELNYSL